MAPLLSVTSNKSLLIEQYLRDQKKEKKYQTYIINQDYQRNYVWVKNSIKQDLIHSILLNRPIGALVLWSNIDDELGQKNSQIVDGQQRLETIKNFWNGTFRLDCNHMKDIVNNKLFKLRLEEEVKKETSSEKTKSYNLLNLNKTSFSYEDLPEFLKDQFLSYELNVTAIDESMTEEEIREYFAVLQNQEQLKAGELLNAFSSNPIKELIQEEEFDKFSKISKFNDKRKALLKNLSSAIGMVMGIVNIGEEDAQIVKKMSRISFDKINNSETSKNIIECFKNDVKNCTIFSQNDKKFRVIGLRVLMLTYVFNDPMKYKFWNLDLGEKVDIIKRTTEISGLWSARDRNKPEIALKKLKDNFKINSEIERGFLKIWDLSKSTHGMNSFEDKKDDVFAVLEFMKNNKNLSAKSLIN